MRGRRAWRDERGATLIIVAILIVMLLGFVGLAIDSGRLYQERRELHNGADAAALAVASSCAEMLPDECSEATEMPTAEEYAALNAHDGFAGVDSLVIDHVEQTVYVETHTIEPDGTEESDPWLIQIVGGGSTRVRADATAKYGQLAGTSVVPLVVSWCEFSQFVLDTPVKIYVHGTHPDETDDDEGIFDTCTARPGFDLDGDAKLPAGFGWLESEGICPVYIDGTLDQDVWYPAEPGNAVPRNCKDIIEAAALAYPSEPASIIILPIFVDAWAIGQSEGEEEPCTDPEVHCPPGAARYRIGGFAAFKVKTYRFPGMVGPGWSPCERDTFCIEGEFTEYVAHIGEFGDGLSYGVTLVKLIE